MIGTLKLSGSMGIEIEGYQDNREGYYLIDREFELSEIRLLCDVIAASDMIKEETWKKRSLRN